MLSKVLQAVMRHDTTLLSKRTWAIAIADSLKPLDIKMCKPRVRLITYLARHHEPSYGLSWAACADEV